MQRKALYIVGILGIIAVGYIATNKSGKSEYRKVEVDPSQERTTPPEPKLQVPNRPAPSAPQSQSATSLAGLDALNITIDRDPNHTTPFSTTIIRLAKEHPELGLSESDVTVIQKAYTDLCFARLRLEVSLAKITPLTAQENYIEIPKYADQGQALAAQLKKVITDQMQERSAAAIDAIAPLFEGDNRALGKVEQKLVISATNDNGYDYKVVRQIAHSDPATGEIIGKATGIDQVKRQSMGAYAAQTEFFPPLHNP